MSLEFKKFKYHNKNTLIDEVDFVVENGQITNFLLNDPKEMKIFKKTLFGKENNSSGRMLIDNQDILDHKFVKTKVEIVKLDTFIERLIPAKWALVGTLLSNQKFLRRAKIKNADKKYDYLSFVAANNNLSDMELRRDIDEMINAFVNEHTKTEQKDINRFKSEYKKYNTKKAVTIFGEKLGFPQQIEILYKTISNLNLDIFFDSRMLIFLQALYDGIYKINELRYSCTCEYNAKRSANKLVKKNHKTFSYAQTKYMVQKQLKFINFKITELRIQIIKSIREMKRAQRRVEFELDKFLQTEKAAHFVKLDLQNEEKEWFATLQNQKDDFVKQQELVMFKMMPPIIEELAEKIAYRIHSYHEDFLTNNIRFGNPNEFKKLKEYYNNQIQSIWAQALQWTSNHTNKLGIKFEWFLTSGIKISSLNRIYLRIIIAIYRNKPNVVITEFANSLNQKDFNELIHVIYSIIDKYPNMSFVFLSNAFNKLPNFQKNTYTLENKEIVNLSSSDIYNGLINESKIDSGFVINVMHYVKTGTNQIEIENKYWKIDDSIFGDKGNIYLNPFEISTDMSENEYVIPIPIKIQKTNKFNDAGMHYGITDYNNKVYFYAPDVQLIKGERIVIYLSEKTIAKIIGEKNE